MAHVVFSGSDYSVLLGPSAGGPLVSVGNLESILWTEKKTKNANQDSIEGSLVLARYQEHPLFSHLTSFCNAVTIGQIPKLDIHLQALVTDGSGQHIGSCCVLLGVTVQQIQDGMSMRDLSGAISVKFTAEGVSHWHKT